MASVASVELLAERTMRKIRWRILPLVFVIYVVAFLDRANVAYAKLTMSADLGFSEAVYGFGAGVFFVGYLLLEIPGALIVQRWGARRWFARILISWGLCAALVGVVKTPTQFYVTRFFLGLAEAGLVPGVMVYLNQWFPSVYRAGAMARFFMASPIALAIGGPIAGWILKFNWLGKPGWRWVFILEAIPAILLGIVTLLVMTDRPERATWLEPEERKWVHNELEKEERQKASLGKVGIWQALRQRNVIILALMTFMSNIGIAGFFLWLPTTVQKASGLPPYLSATVSGLPFAVAVASQLSFSWSSDRTGERYLHTAVPLIIAGLIFPITTLPSLSFGWLLFWLCVSSAAIYGYAPSYWVLPTLSLGESAVASAFGFINIFSGLGSFVGPSVVGEMLTIGYRFSVVVFLLSVTFIAAGTLTFALDHEASRKST
jgi:ACS family tartrate transporter-like MFS transporter